MGNKAETVVVVHGLWVHGVVFVLFRRWLARHGFNVRTFSYRTVRDGFDVNTRALARFVAACDGSTIHLVGHSLGGLVVLNMLEKYPDPRIRRAVIMGSPCVGSHCVSVLLRTPGLARIVGRSFAEWQVIQHPPLVTGVDVGVLSGSRSIGLGRFIAGLPHPNDGVIAIAETGLPGSLDSITLPVAHSEMVVSPACVDQVAAFLESGRFRHG